MDGNKYIKVTRLKKSAISFFFMLLAILSVGVPIVFLICGLLSIYFAYLDFKKGHKLGIIFVVVVILCGFISIGRYISNRRITADPNEENILVGTWEYGTAGGEYQFNEDMTYTQYSSSDKSDYYCTGEYVYEYGYETKEGQIKRFDNDFIYYYLILKPKECIIDGASDTTEEGTKQKEMVFCHSKTEEVENVMVNIKTDEPFAIKKPE